MLDPFCTIPSMGDDTGNRQGQSLVASMPSSMPWAAFLDDSGNIAIAALGVGVLSSSIGEAGTSSGRATTSWRPEQEETRANSAECAKRASQRQNFPPPGALAAAPLFFRLSRRHAARVTANCAPRRFSAGLPGGAEPERQRLPAR